MPHPVRGKGFGLAADARCHNSGNFFGPLRFYLF
jgi:hypothetical protein